MKTTVLILVCAASLLLSCGKELRATSANDNQCSFRMIAGHNCIVCEKGGVSCQWD